MKTRILAMLLAVVMAVSLTACTSSGSHSSKQLPAVPADAHMKRGTAAETT